MCRLAGDHDSEGTHSVLSPENVVNFGARFAGEVGAVARDTCERDASSSSEINLPANELIREYEVGRGNN